MSVSIFLPHLRIKRLKAGSQNYRPYIYFYLLRRLIEIYGVILTYCFANTTFLLFKVKTAFIYISYKWNCLSKIYMDGFILRYFLIILIRVFGRAVFYTGSTTGALVLSNIPGLFNQRYLEVSCFPCYTVNFSIGENLYIGMPADLDQLGCEYSHGAVIGRKGLVKLGHMAPNARLFLNQIHLKTSSGKVKCGLNTADPSTDNHYVSKITISKVFTKLLNIVF